MAQVTTQEVVKGQSGITVRVDFAGDGTGDLENHVVLSTEDLLTVPNPKRVPAFRLMQAWYSMVWFDVSLKVGTLEPNLIWPFARDTGNYIDFRPFGGLFDSDIYGTQPQNTDGTLTVSTNDLVVGSTGTLILDLVLTNAASS